MTVGIIGAGGVLRVPTFPAGQARGGILNQLKICTVRSAAILRGSSLLVLLVSVASCGGEPAIEMDDATSETSAALRASPPAPDARTADLDARARLGRAIFEDTRLSASGSLACAGCHVADRAFTGSNDPDAPLAPVSTGAFPTLLGGRNAPTAMYAKFSPRFDFVLDEDEYTPTGGLFWDGRADSLAEQAKGPFLNPKEMALASKDEVVARLRTAPYARLFERVYGRQAFDDVERAYDDMADAIQSFEEGAIFAPFSSKFDAVLRGRAHFTPLEARGFALFKDPNRGNCIACHVGDPTSREPSDWLFTDFTYDNLGVPRNPALADNADPTHFDLGLCLRPGIAAKVPAEVSEKDAFVSSLCGAFKVPTLRNVAVTAPYMHNGYFGRLRDVVSFYVTRDTNPERWYPCGPDGKPQKFNDLPPAYAGNVNTTEVPYGGHPGGKPRLDEREIDAVVAFLQTLTDGYIRR